jgi:hypothetical protein
MKTEKFNLSDLEMHDKHGSGYLYTEQVKEFIKILKEEFKRNWDIDFKDSPLKQLTAHDEMCFKNCDCSEIICNWIDKLAGKELVE